MGAQCFVIGVRQGGQHLVGQRTRDFRVQNNIPPGRSGPFSAGIDVAFRDDASTGGASAYTKLQAGVCSVTVRSGRDKIYTVGSMSGDAVWPPLSNSIACARYSAANPLRRSCMRGSTGPFAKRVARAASHLKLWPSDMSASRTNT